MNSQSDNTTPSPAAGSKELREKIVSLDGVPTSPAHSNDTVIMTTVEKIIDFIATQNNATYAAVMEALESSRNEYDVRQRVTKIFGRKHG